MATNAQLEQRLTAVESAVGELKRQLAKVSTPVSWIEQISRILDQYYTAARRDCSYAFVINKE